MALDILRNIASDLQRASFFTIMADESTDKKYELSLLHTITKGHNTTEDTRSPFQESMLTSIVSFCVLLNYGIVYQNQPSNWIL